MHFILIIMLSAGYITHSWGSPAVATASFNTQAGCEAAAKAANAEIDGELNVKGKAFCISDK